MWLRSSKCHNLTPQPHHLWTPVVNQAQPIMDMRTYFPSQTFCHFMDIIYDTSLHLTIAWRLKLHVPNYNLVPNVDFNDCGVSLWSYSCLHMPCKVGSNDCNVSIISLFTYSMLCRQIMNFVWVQYMKEWFDRSDVIHLFRDVSIYSLNKWGFLHSPCIVSCDRLKGSGFTHHIILHMLYQTTKPSYYSNEQTKVTYTWYPNLFPINVIVAIGISS